MWKNVGAVVVGLLVGMAVNMGLILLNTNVLFPMPEGANMSDPVQMAAYVAGLPAQGFVLVLLAHVGQAAVGGWVAARMAGSVPLRLALIIGALTVVGSVINGLQLPGPPWLWIEVPLELLAAWGVGTLELRRRGA